ncbi:MepB family protein [Flavobacterium sp.]|uniref:MepB family protein n=1 Tax=Flavobacterium sp. TaxID=239 RepID=UPI003D6B4CE0
MNTALLPNGLKEIRVLVFDSFGFEFSNLFLEKESTEYEACQFELNGKKVLFRSAKITPTKTGLFVTIWKREGKGPIAPFEDADPIDLFVISTKKEGRLGHFVFPKEVLAKKGIVTTGLKEGKRGIRVYPPWDTDLNKQAQKTQQWQLDYFLEIPSDKVVDAVRIKQLYNL